MNKNAIKKFAIEARQKLIASVTDKAGMLGITAEGVSEPTTKGNDFEVYQTAAGTEVTLNKKQCEQRRRLAERIHARGFEEVVEEVAYTWFNRICAIRFMEVNDYMYPVRIRVLSSEKEGKNEPDIVTMAPDIDWHFTDKEREDIIDAKMNNRLDDLFRVLFIKQCNLLHEVLLGLFEETEDYTEMLLDISFTNKDDVIRMLVDGIDEKDFNITTIDEDGKTVGQVEIIGWLYQYYNTEPKNKAFAKKGKITKEELPIITQLFTPDWIVRYMVENSLGRMWIEGHPDGELKSNWKYYLDEAKQEESAQQELDKIKAEYAALKLEDIKLIDPCMGSGHILVYAFDVFMQIYENAGWSQREAAQSIIDNNIYGLDIDDRAAQLSYFAVLMKARQYDRKILTRGIEPNVYAVQESNGINRSQLMYFGGGLTEGEKKTAVSQMEGLINTFNDAKEYGSLLNVESYDWELLEKFVERTETASQMSFDTYGLNETAEQLKRLIKIGRIMARKYEVVVTNPPYAGTSNLSSKVNDFVKKNYPDSKADLFAVFIEHCGEMLKKKGYQAMVTQHAWMFLSSYEKLRLKLQQRTIVNMAHLGARAFEEIAGEVVQTTSFVMRKNHMTEYQGTYCRLVEPTTQQGKEDMYLAGENYYVAKQFNFSKISGLPIAYWVSDSTIKAYDYGQPIGEIAPPKTGMTTGDNDRFLRFWYEIEWTKVSIKSKSSEEAEKSQRKWFPYCKGGGFRRWYGYNEYLVNWKNDGFEIKNNIKDNGLKAASVRSESMYFKPLITWSAVTSGKFSCRYCFGGSLFDSGGSSISVSNHIYYLLALLNTKVGQHFLNISNATINYQPGDIAGIPVVFNNIDDVESKTDSNINLSRMDWNSFETSWDFKVHPLIRCVSFPRKEMSEDENHYIQNMKSIKEAFNNWSNECHLRFTQLKENEEELNRIFIDIYGLQDELTQEVEDKDVTVRKADLQRDIKSFISYAVGCMFGRYSLDEEGLVLAGQPFESHFIESSAPRCGTGFAGAPGFSVPTGEFYYKTDDGVKKCTYNPDKDNIIPITDEEYFSDDIVVRFIEFVKIVYGSDTLEENLDFIAKALGNKGDTSREVIRNYFLKDFYPDHLKIYQKRPIYWMFDSGKENGFKALIYVHRYTSDTVGIIRTDYLHKTQKAIEQAMQRAQYTSENASGAADKKKAVQQIAKYTKQLSQMKSYDEAMAHIANQRIEIDLDDGVKVNYEKFQGIEVAQEGKKALKIDLLAKIK